MNRALFFTLFAGISGCTTNPTPRPTGTAPSTSAAPAEGLPTASASPAESGLKSSPTTSGAPEPADAGVALPDCKGATLVGEIELPPTDALPLSNASTDASVDRGYPELAPTLQRVLPGLRCCYTAARKTRAELAGKLVVELGLAPDGKVKSVSQAPGKSDINDPMLGSCVAATLKEASFPASRRGQATWVVFPLVFRPGEAR